MGSVSPESSQDSMQADSRGQPLVTSETVKVARETLLGSPILRSTGSAHLQDLRYTGKMIDWRGWG